jgi:hypothetical protein
VAKEEAAYRQLAEKLGVGDKSARGVLDQQRKLAWV